MFCGVGPDAQLPRYAAESHYVAVVGQVSATVSDTKILSLAFQSQLGGLIQLVQQGPLLS